MKSVIMDNMETMLQNEQKVSRLTKIELAEELIQCIWAKYNIESYESALLERAVKELRKKEVDDQKLARLQQLEWAVEWFVECVEAGQFLRARTDNNPNFLEIVLGFDPWSSCYKEWNATYNQAWQDVLEAMS